ncbi:MAG: putative sulfate/molybdate transporter [Deltaproteobacteria bacterium]|nr:putative sulfate/molybdate transporter [Deltaproteobacteria bacterium]
MSPPYRFDRMEIAGSLGDLGTLLPIAIGMILINGLSPIGIFFSIGIYFILSGIYYGITVPVQPMKVIGAYAIATAMTSSQVLASAALMGLILLIIGGTNAITLIGRYIPKPVVRGVQLSTGILLMAQGVKFMIGTSKFQAVRNMAEPYLTVQHIGPVSIGIVIGIIGAFLTLLLLENRKFPAGLVVILGGLFLGLVLGTHEGLANLKIGIYFPELMPFGFPAGADFTFAFFALVLPQVPMTIGNAVVANADLSREYFGEDSKKVTYRSLTLSMGLANLMAFVLGGMPLCHGAGGLAAHYRFGARTAGSNLFIGSLFLALALFLGAHALSVVYLLPMAILGVLLVFAGGQLALTILDMKTRKDLFVVLLMLGITLASNLAVGFMAGIAVAYVLKSERLQV